MRLHVLRSHSFQYLDQFQDQRLMLSQAITDLSKQASSHLVRL